MNSAESNWQFVFLFGLSRSGTSWVGKIFDSHPQTLYKHEPDTFSELPKMPWVADLSEVDVFRPAVDDFLSLLPSVNTAFVAGSLPVFRKTYRSGWRDSTHLLSVLAAKLGRKVSMGFPVLPCADYNSHRNLRLIWKSICSLGRLGVLLRVARNRKAIILLRHPCGVIASLKRGRARGYLRHDPSVDYALFELLLNTAAGRRYGITIESVRRMQPEERLAWKWVLFYEKALEDITGFDDAVLVVRYEDICADPKRWTRKMLELSGLPWNSQTEAFLERSTSKASQVGLRPVGSGYFSVFQDPMGAANGWRQELDPAEIERVACILRRSPLGRFYPSAIADGNR